MHSDAVLTFSYVGYVTEEIAVGNRSVIDVTLSPDITALSEIVVIGYGTQKKKEVTGAVARVANEQLVQNATADLGTALQGEIAGVNVQLASGDPGAGRGGSSTGGALRASCAARSPACRRPRGAVRSSPRGPAEAARPSCPSRSR